jgi:hypothetical protein
MSGMATYWERVTGTKPLFGLHICGLALYVVAFFLPSGGSPYAHTVITSGPNSNVMAGWQCAWAIMWLSFAARSWSYASILIVLIAWVNPLVIFYTVLTLSDWLPRARPYLAIVIVCCLAASCLYLFHNAPVIVLVGYYVWVGGILVLLIPSLLRLKPQFQERD